MQVGNIAIKELKPYPNNPRLNKSAVDAVAKSISLFGFRNPILANKDLVVICGHTRLQAAKSLNLEEVPVIVIDDLDEERQNALRIADNSTAGVSEWDYSRLLEEMTGISIDLTGLNIPDAGRVVSDTKLNTRCIVPIRSSFFYIRCDIADTHRVVRTLETMRNKLEKEGKAMTYEQHSL